MCFTQNIDTLERRAGVPAEKIVEAHGSFATQRCIDCRREHDDVKMKKAVLEGAIPRCEHCKGLVKPDIVFFGEAVRPLCYIHDHYLTANVYFVLFISFLPFSINQFSSFFKPIF
jgi:NAD-dependent SIR2 family protein deacetylase